MNWRKTLVSLIIIVVLFIISIGLYSLFAGMGESAEKSQRIEPTLYVKTEKVLYTSNEAQIVETGRLSSEHTVDLSAEVQGEILPGAVPLREGTKFSKGTLLVKIFDEEARNSLKASKSRFLNSVAGVLPDLKIDYPDIYPAFEKFFDEVNLNEPLPPLPQVNSEAAKIFLANRNLLNDYFTIKSAEVRLSKYQLYAPFDGTFTAVYLQPGAIANPGSRIASMIRTDKLEMEVPVRIEDAYWIHIGDPVQVFTKDRKMDWTGQVIRKSEFMDPATQTITIYISLEPKRDKPLYQGQYLLAEFSSKSLPNSMRIPRNAIFEQDRVFTVQDGKLVKNQVNLLKTNQTDAFINGLPEGVDLVVEPLIGGREGINAEILERP